MNPFNRRAGEQGMDSNITFIRADQNCICEQCGKRYGAHPMDKLNPDWDGRPYLHVLCNGLLVKL